MEKLFKSVSESLSLSRRLEGERKGEKGFTLIELLVVVAIIAILAAIAIPQFAKYRKQAAAAAMQADARNCVTDAISQITSYQMRNENPPTSNTYTNVSPNTNSCVWYYDAVQERTECSCYGKTGTPLNSVTCVAISSSSGTQVQCSGL
jgi:type IV pilus assembly protein PilA